ncbi:MAG: nucleotide exchange factor GrpE [Bosea sp. (in: a-proteobacteria)]
MEDHVPLRLAPPEPQDETEMMTTHNPADDPSQEPMHPVDQPIIDHVAVLEAEKADLKDKLLRLLAEMENLRRRTEKEVSDAKAYAVTGFARDMVGVSDNLRRALEGLPIEGRAMLDAGTIAMIEGVELTERDLVKTLEKHGVKRIEPLGQKFDPNLHQAMFEAPDAVIAKGAVVQVVQAGFTIGERVLRPALVGVSSGQPATAPPDPAPQG